MLIQTGKSETNFKTTTFVTHRFQRAISLLFVRRSGMNYESLALLIEKRNSEFGTDGCGKII